MPKITALTNYSTLNSVSDVLPIVDITNDETKKIAMSVLMGLITDITNTYKFSIVGTENQLINNANANTILSLRPGGSATRSTLRFNANNGVYICEVEASGNTLNINSIYDVLYFQRSYSNEISCWNNISSGNPLFYINGFVGGNRRYVRFNVDTSGNFNIEVEIADVKLNTNIYPTGYKAASGNVGVSGSFTTVDLKTVTVENGIITAIV